MFISASPLGILARGLCCRSALRIGCLLLVGGGPLLGGKRISIREGSALRSVSVAPLKTDLRIRVAPTDAGKAEVNGLVVDEAGRIFALDRRAKVVRVFDRVGHEVRELGGPGGGAAEFVQPVGIALDPRGRLWVVDAGRARIVVFDGSGAFSAAYPRAAHGYPTHWLGGFDRAGRFYDTDLLAPPRDGMQLVRCSGEMTACTELALPYAIQPTFSIEKGRMVISADVPFTGRLLWRLDRGGAIWFGSSDSYRLTHRTFAGETLAIIAHRAERVAVRDADKAAAIASLQWYTQQGGVLDTARFGKYKPTVAGVSVGETEQVWVQVATPTDSRSSAFDVFQTNGEFLRRITVDGQVHSTPPPYITRRGLYAVAQSETGETLVVRYPIGSEHRARGARQR
jgi:hypothetical protein